MTDTPTPKPQSYSPGPVPEFDPSRETGVQDRVPSELPGERKVTNAELLDRIMGLADIAIEAGKTSEGNAQALIVLSKENAQIVRAIEHVEQSIGAETARRDEQFNAALNRITASLSNLETSGEVMQHAVQVLGGQVEILNKRIAVLETEGREQNKQLNDQGERLGRLEKGMNESGHGGSGKKTKA